MGIIPESVNPMTLLELNEVISALVEHPSTAGLWITAETSDLSRRRHCYMELVQKNDAGDTVARARATIWANNLYPIDAKFTAATGQLLASGMKVMVRVTVTYHPVYGLALVIDDINPEFTLGDVLRRRAENIRRLTEEGIIDMNRTLEWSDPMLRIAVISSESAAGYGDFENQLHNNSHGLKFYTRLFHATMQGTTAARSIIEALTEVGQYATYFDIVVIIRGGGSSDDLSCFEDYDLAANIAQFPLPIIIGIGHERDVTLLDYVAAMRVKTPTAAAEWLISRGTTLLSQLDTLGNDIRTTASLLITSSEKHLATLSGQLGMQAVRTVETTRLRLLNAASAIGSLSTARIEAEKVRMDNYATNIKTTSSHAITTASSTIDAFENLLAVLSPEAVLKRGYTMTIHDGKIITSAAGITSGDIITTRFADGEISSKTI